jgi:act minimal PKS acyl carrier protein
MREFTLVDLMRTIGTCLGSAYADAVTEETLDVRFDDLGYDSLAVYELAARLEDDLRIDIPDSAVEAMTTPRAVFDYVNGRLAAV